MSICRVISEDNEAPLAASILFKGTKNGYSTGSTGTTSVTFPANGSYTLITSALGYEEKEIKIIIPFILRKCQNQTNLHYIQNFLSIQMNQQQ
ncbi:MAG: carboxypeptidase-like regulatory domain-containing protein [Flavisolibacter sp.]|nr:carboxypeptidase-like regulatory domain-containing protein [Flavisolibacter sp.]